MLLYWIVIPKIKFQETSLFKPFGEAFWCLMAHEFNGLDTDKFFI